MTRSRLLFLRLICALVAVTALGGGSAWAAAKVVLLELGRSGDLLSKSETLLAAELRASGFEVIEVPSPGGQNVRATLETASVAHNPIATIALVPAGKSFEVWISDRVTGKLVLRTLAPQGSQPDAIAVDLALRAVELLRGSLLELRFEASKRPSPGAAPPPAPTAPEVARFVGEAKPVLNRPFALQGLGLWVAVSVLENGADLGAAWAPTARLSLGTPQGWVARVSFSGPSATHELFTDGGAARMKQLLLYAEGLRLFRPGETVQPLAKLGLGLHDLLIEGRGASELFAARTPSRLIPFASVGGGLSVRLARSVAVLVEIELNLATRSTAVTIAGDEVARFGRLFGTGSVGLASAF